MNRLRRALAPCLALALLLTGCATNPVTGDADFVLMSREQEIELGRDYHKQILKQYQVYENEAIQQRVERIGQRLAKVSHRPDLEFTFTVLDSPEVNAFALPGGYIYITRGIMAYFNSEAELAGVIGHEIGHVTARHSVQQYSAETATSLLGTILLAGTDAGAGAAQLFQTVQLAAIRGYGREQELEADRLGAQYLARAGYDSDEMLDVIGVLADQEEYAIAQAKAEGREPSVYHGIFSTHPENDARLKEVIRAAKKYQAENPRPSDHAEYVRLIDGMTFGPGRDQGMVVDHQFLHLELDAALTAPGDWTLINQPQQLVFQAPDDGALMIATIESVKGSASARQILNQRVEGAELRDARSISAGPYQGHTGIVAARTQMGVRDLRISVIRKGDHAWVFTGAARERGALAAFDDDFLEIATSLRTLTPEQRREAQPLEIQAYMPKAGDTYEALARPVSGRLDDAAAELRLLNGDWPDGRPEPGRLIKVLR
jgi:predicted Zn-dependent protease